MSEPTQQASPALPTLVTVEKAVEMLGGHLTRHILYRNLATGALRGHQPGGKKGRWLIDVADLAAWARGEDPQEAASAGGSTVAA